jgi:serine/threonine protein phosphatase PrpC
MKISYAGATTPGIRYGELNQDSFLNTTYTHDGRKCHVWAVFDGHAPLGEYASQLACSTFSAELEKVFTTGGQFTDERITRVFDTTHKAIVNFYKEVPTK